MARVSAAMFTISYAETVAISVLCGALWDFIGIVQAAFLPIVLAILPSIRLAPTIKFGRRE